MGGDADGPDQGAAPSPWDLPASPTKPFHSEVKVIEVNFMKINVISIIMMEYLLHKCVECYIYSEVIRKFRAIWYEI